MGRERERERESPIESVKGSSSDENDK